MIKKFIKTLLSQSAGIACGMKQDVLPALKKLARRRKGTVMTPQAGNLNLFEKFAFCGILEDWSSHNDTSSEKIYS
jgi:hypothetical protein